MKNKEQAIGAYEAPMVEIIEVEVEQGFATSAGTVGGTTVDEDMTGGGGIPVTW